MPENTTHDAAKIAAGADTEWPQTGSEPTRLLGAHDPIALLQAIIDHAPAGIFVKDLAGRYLIVSSGFAHTTGMAAAQMLGRTDRELFPPALAAELCQSDQRVLAGGAPVCAEEHLPMADGEHTFIVLKFPLRDAGGATYALCGIATDITDRKRIMRELKESEQRYKSLFEHNSDLIFAFDLAGNAVSINPAVERVTGYRREELLGQGHRRLYEPAGGVPPLCLAGQAPAGEPVTYETTIRHRDGQPIHLEVTALPMVVDGVLAGSYCVARDVTERKRAEVLQRLLAETGTALASALDYRAILARITALTVEHLADWCGVYAFGADGRVQRLAAAQSDPALAALLAEDQRRAPPRRDRIAPVFTVLRTGRGVLVAETAGAQPPDSATDAGPVAWLRRLGVRSYMAVPLVARGQVLGAMLLLSTRPGRCYTPADLAVAEELGRRAGIALHDARLHEATHHAAFHDALTGLPNRALFLNRLEHLLQRRSGSGGLLALLCLDLDRFQVINDSLGHAAGDRLLMETARRLRRCVRVGDTVARLGSDEFALLLEVVQDVGDATGVAERVLQEMAQPLLLDGREVFCSASVGVFCGDQSHSPQDLLRMAGIALHQAKAQGGDRYALFTPDMDAGAAGLQLETDLRRAVKESEFTLDFQPIVRLATGEIVTLEALIRWCHPQRGLVLPGEFIPLAEEVGLIVPIGRWVLAEACRQAVAWQRKFPALPPVKVNVNLSARQIQQPDFVSEVEQILAETGLNPHHLQLEITESLLMQDAEVVRRTLLGLRQMGITLAMDDFGTGYSSLHYLRRFPIGQIKIDRSFVAGLGRGGEDAALVRTVISLGKVLGMAVTAEGVETGEQAALLHGLGCDLGQGYYFHPPVPAAEVPALLAAGPLRVLAE